MAETQKKVAVAVDFNTRALEMAQDMTMYNEYEGKTGQAWAEARAADIRRVWNILTGNEPGRKTAPELIDTGSHSQFTG